MNTVTLEVASRGKANQRFLRPMDGEAQGAFISFETPELLFKVLAGKRWDLLKMMTGAGAMAIREAARRVGAGCKGGARGCQNPTQRWNLAENRA
jgi:predicted transcriptional regulator